MRNARKFLFCAHAKWSRKLMRVIWVGTIRDILRHWRGVAAWFYLALDPVRRGYCFANRMLTCEADGVKGILIWWPDLFLVICAGVV